MIKKILILLKYKLINFTKSSMIQRVSSIKTETELTYNEKPKVSAIVQFFNKRQNISSLINALRLAPIDEIIVIDDGSSDGSYKDWIEHLTQPNDFLIRSNDLYEVRTYSRAIDLARGEYIILLQDDDIPPASPAWVEEAISLFETFPKLLILGGRLALDLLTPDIVNPGGDSVYKEEGDIAGTPGVNKYRIIKKPKFLTSEANLPFMFAEYVNRAPMFLRRKEVLDLGGISQEFAPFQCDDADICIRAWLSGYQVGFYNSDFVRDIGVGGMRLFNKEAVPKQAMKNWQLIYSKYSDVIKSKTLNALVAESNSIFDKRLE
jgi:GT2 family glycosyltransferase